MVDCSTDEFGDAVAATCRTNIQICASSGLFEAASRLFEPTCRLRISGYIKHGCCYQAGF